MRALLILGAGFALTALFCEVPLRSRRLQAAVGRVAIVHGVGSAAVVAVLTAGDHMRVASILIFWSGAMLSWFGVRSHLESSILLRMIHLLRRNPMTRRDLTSLYESWYGTAKRVDELRRAGLVRLDDGRGTILPTRKGLLIARVAARLR